MPGPVVVAAVPVRDEEEEEEEEEPCVLSVHDPCRKASSFRRDCQRGGGGREGGRDEHQMSDDEAHQQVKDQSLSPPSLLLPSPPSLPTCASSTKKLFSFSIRIRTIRPSSTSSPSASASFLATSKARLPA